MAAELGGDGDRSAQITELVRAAQQGRREAFDVVIELYVGDMFRLAAAIAGPEDGRDAAQEAFVAAWRDLPRLRTPATFEAWLRRIVVHRSQNAIRSRRRRPALSLEASEVEANRVAAPGDFRDEVHARDALDGAFEELSPEQRAVVALHYGAGYSLSDIASVTETRLGTIKSRLNAALRRLRAVVPEESR
jgi:RNA polymerase sigma-70 factor (ECF subfamily)